MAKNKWQFTLTPLDVREHAFKLLSYFECAAEILKDQDKEAAAEFAEQLDDLCDDMIIGGWDQSTKQFDRVHEAFYAAYGEVCTLMQDFYSGEPFDFDEAFKRAGQIVPQMQWAISERENPDLYSEELSRAGMALLPVPSVDYRTWE